MNDRKIEIERNIIENFLMWIKDYFKTRRKPLVISLLSVIVLIVLIILATVYYGYRAENELKEFEKILDKYYSLQDPEKEKSLATTVDDLNRVINNSMWGFVHKNGYYTIAGLFLSANKYSEAKDYFLKFAEKSPSSFFTPLALHQAGIIYERSDNIGEALKLYKRLEEKYKKSIIIDETYYDLGRMYQAAGDAVKAKEYYNKVISEFPVSMFSSKAKNRIFTLGRGGITEKKIQLPE